MRASAGIAAWGSPLLLVSSCLLLAACGSGAAPQGELPPDLSICVGAPCPGGTGCLVDRDCPGGRCDTTSHLCAGCLGDGDCGDGRLCAPTTRTCVAGCSAGHPCGDAGVCQLAAGRCVGCLADGDCRDPDLALCDTATSSCQPCLPAAGKDRCGHALYCAPAASGFDCASGCKTDDDCAPLPPDGGAPRPPDLAAPADASRPLDLAVPMADGDGGTPAGDDGGSDGGSGGGDGGAAPRDLATVDLLAPALAVVSRCNVAAHQCVRCLADGDCPIGKVCSGNQCVAGCTASHGCAAPATCCDGQCTVVADDTANCGACGNACNGGWSCCGGVCANPNNSVDDCGGCGHSCAARHGTPQCAARACVIGACDDGWQDCNGVVGDGCEVNVAANINNCGACSNACSIPHAQSKCAASTCVIDVCIFPYADCDGSLDNGCETNIGGNDPGNCGGCGAVCSGDHVGGTTCAAGQCTGACVAGYADCDGNKQRNGCEISTSSDPGNCGGCGNACSTVNIAQPACTGGQCTGDCDAGYADCDFNKASNGCERSVASDAQNCGGCNQVCSSNNILHPTCGGGACDGDCNDGTDDCDGSKLANGCESLIARQGSCSHPLTQTGSTLSGGCDPDGCVSQICKNGAFSGCCFFIGFFSSWDQGCVDQVASLCHRRAPVTEGALPASLHRAEPDDSRRQRFAMEPPPTA